MKIITAASVAEDKFKNGETREVRLYAGSAQANKESTDPIVLGSERYKVGAPRWKNSEGHFKLWNEIHELQSKLKEMNAAGPIDPTTAAGFFAKLFIDVQRQSDELLDIVPFIAMVIANDAAQEISYLRDWLPFIGKEKVISGTNDQVPLIDAKTATTAQIVQYVRAFGFKSSLKTLAFDSGINYLQRVTEAAARIKTDYRNQQIMAPINAVTFGAKHKQAADAAGATFDLKMYNTLRIAKKTLGKLYHPMYTKKLVSALSQFSSQVGLLCHPSNLWDIQRVISGFTAGGFVQDIAPLPIGNVIAYAGGIQDGETWGEETLSLPGVTEGKAYMFIPDQAVVVDKRDVTLETSPGSALQLSTEERSWHRISGENTTYLIGGAAANDGKGCIVEITLPTE